MTPLRSIFRLAIVVWTVAITTGCHPVLKREAQPPEEALSEVRLFPHPFSDDMDQDSLILAIKRNLAYFDRLDSKTVFHYGPDVFTLNRVRESQEAFLDLLSKRLGPTELNTEIRRKFRVYRAPGRVRDGRVLFTGYFEPVYEGRLTSDDTFRYPLYGLPDDLTRIDLSSFGDRFKGQSIVARIEGKKVTPYYSRSQIETEKVLTGQGLELAWLKDPVDVAFLHIQGSGRVRLPDGQELPVHYRGSNGQPYRSIGRYMIEKGFLSPEEMSMQAIRRYLVAHPEALDAVLNDNPSYIFFHLGENGPKGSLGVQLTPGRSIALDSGIFPKGGLGFISCRKPVVNDQGEITGWTPFFRFVVNQDTGGAIKGPGRADIFWGRGPYAELAAGHLQHEGDLFFLMMKPSE
jgi:membrane-bound lytic murein transglycosylase A